MRNLIINPLGEIIINDVVQCGHVNLSELKRKIGREPTNKEVGKEFDDDARAVLTAPEYRQYKKWAALSSELATDLFRFYVAKGKILMSIEFIAFSDNSEAWSKIEKYAKQFGAKVETMIEAPLSDRWSNDYGKTWNIGKDDGRMEKQVELSIDVSKRTLNSTAKLVSSMMKSFHTHNVNSYLVSVI